jgi:hypothetical protein
MGVLLLNEYNNFKLPLNRRFGAFQSGSDLIPNIKVF